MKSIYLLVVLFICCTSAAQGKPIVLAVFPLQARGLDTNSLGILEEALSNGLIQTGKVRLVERSQVRSVLAEQGFQQTGACEGSECVVQMGKMLGVARGVVGSVGLLGRTYVFNARIIDIGTGEIVATSQRSLGGKIDDALTDLVPQVVADLTRTLPREGYNGAAPPAKASGSHWGLWTFGMLAVAGGATAAVLLLSKPAPQPSPTPVVEPTTDPVVDPTGTLTFRWN